MYKRSELWLLIGILAASAFHLWHPFDIQAPHSLAAEEAARIGDLSIANTLITCWVTMLALIAVSVLATRNVQDVRRGLRNLVVSQYDPGAGPRLGADEPGLRGHGGRLPAVLPIVASFELGDRPA